jgi:hypothetical protein
MKIGPLSIDEQAPRVGLYKDRNDVPDSCAEVRFYADSKEYYFNQVRYREFIVLLIQSIIGAAMSPSGRGVCGIPGYDYGIHLHIEGDSVVFADENDELIGRERLGPLILALCPEAWTHAREMAEVELFPVVMIEFWRAASG